MVDEINIPPYESVRIVVYGDLMLDRYWYGQTSRISPEAPIPIVNIDQMEVRPGGAANVALNVAALGASVELMGVLGDDREARELESLLNNSKSINCQFQRLVNHPTITKLRVLGQNQQLLRLDFEKTLKNYEDQDLLQHYQNSLSQAQAVILSDYAKGALFNVTVLIKHARNKGLPVLVDPKSSDFNRYEGATLLTPNLKEFEDVVGFCQTDQELESKARTLIRQLHLEALLLTKGEQGMTLFQKDKTTAHLITHAREVYDVTGAGDTVISVMAASLAAGSDFYEAAKLANFAAELVVRKLGTTTVTVTELRRALCQMTKNHMIPLRKELLLLALDDARAHGEIIVMTNGCFDILHAGHIYYLETAKAMGHRLIVAINDDQSVARLKGKARPINPLQARMEVLAALHAVDWVVPFSEDTPARLISEVLPDILVKGGDYPTHEIVGSEAVVKNGGKVLTVPIKNGFSTSYLVKKILG